MNRVKRALGPALLAALLWIGQSSAGEARWIIGFPEDNLANDWRAAQVKEIERELAKHPEIEFLVADAGGDVSKNLLDIEAMVEKGARLLFLGPRNPDAVLPLLKRLRARGVHIVLLTRKIAGEEYDTYLSPDDFKIGYSAAGFLAERLRGRGHVLMLGGVPTTTTAKRRKRGFLMGLENYSSMRVTEKVANYSRAEALRVVGEALEQGMNFDAVYAHNDAMATGARLALKAAGIDPGSLPIVSIDFLPETRDAIIAGEQLASYTYPTCGKIGVEVALQLLRGEQTPRYIEVPSVLVTEENVAEVKTVY